MTEHAVTALRVQAFTVPTDGPDGSEQDGTLEWDSTTLVLVEARSGDRTGLGYTYGDRSLADFVRSALAPAVLGQDALAPATLWQRMFAGIRNAGRPGAGAMAVSAVDVALWDLKARLLELPLFRLLPAFHREVPVYGSGGFTNYPLDRLATQLADWTRQGIPRVKLKTSRNPAQDPPRLARAREAVGDDTELYADANGALTVKQALHWAHRFAREWGVTWLEEPVSSADFDGLRLVREHSPPGLEITAGEYAFVLRDFTNLVQAGAVDCLQADVTRCGGITGLLQVSGLAAGHHIDLSAHCAPAISAHACCAVRRLRHLEYFHDHVRVEDILFEGTLTPRAGTLRPHPHDPGLGLRLRTAEAERHRVHGPLTANT